MFNDWYIIVYMTTISLYLTLKLNSVSKRARQTESAALYWYNKNSKKPLHWFWLAVTSAGIESAIWIRKIHIRKKKINICREARTKLDTRIFWGHSYDHISICDVTYRTLCINVRDFVVKFSVEFAAEVETSHSSILKVRFYVAVHHIPYKLAPLTGHWVGNLQNSFTNQLRSF